MFTDLVLKISSNFEITAFAIFLPVPSTPWEIIRGGLRGSGLEIKSIN
jgi:hypothetical protein